MSENHVLFRIQGKVTHMGGINMDEKDILKELNSITYSEDELKQYIAPKTKTEKNELYMRKYFVSKSITEKEAEIFISEKLRENEQILHIMGLQNMHGRIAQAGFGMFSGVGALPFINMNINAILIMTNERLFVSLLHDNLHSSNLHEYELTEVESIKTALEVGTEYLYIKLKGKRIHDFYLYCPEYDYEQLFQKLSDPLSKKGVKLYFRDKKLSYRNKSIYLVYWGLFATFFIYFIYVVFNNIL